MKCGTALFFPAVSKKREIEHALYGSFFFKISDIRTHVPPFSSALHRENMSRGKLRTIFMGWEKEKTTLEAVCKTILHKKRKRKKRI